MNYTMRETHLQANSSEWVFIRKPCTVSDLPTELEALEESPQLTVKLKLFLTVNITSNWISEIQQCFWSTQQPYGRIQYFNTL